MFYFDNTKKYFIYFYLLILLIFILTQRQYKNTLLITISVLLSFDVTYSVLSKDITPIPDHDTGNCNSIINSDSVGKVIFHYFMSKYLVILSGSQRRKSYF